MYEEIFIYDDPKFKGYKIYPIDDFGSGTDYPKLQGDRYASIYTSSSFLNGSLVFTGRFFLNKTETDACYQAIDESGNFRYLWKTDFSHWSPTPKSDATTQKAKDILSELIVYNQQILENNLLCARGLELATETGVALPVEFRKQLYSLQMRLSARNAKIKESGYVENVEESTSPNFSLYNQSIINFMGNPGIGFVISTTVAIIVTCVIIAASAAIAWTLFKSMHTESKVDFSYSNDLLAELAKNLPPEVFKKLMDENAANKKKADDAIAASSTGGVMSTLKYLAIGYLGFTVIDKFLQKRN